MKRASRWAPFSRKHIFTTPMYCTCPEQYDLMVSMTLGAPGFLPGKVNLIPSSSQMPGSSWLICAKTFRRNSDGIELCKLHIAQLIFAALVKQGTCKRPGDLLLEVFLPPLRKWVHCPDKSTGHCPHCTVKPHFRNPPFPLSPLALPLNMTYFHSNIDGGLHAGCFNISLL